jgi:hypothetical protein
MNQNKERGNTMDMEKEVVERLNMKTIVGNHTVEISYLPPDSHLTLTVDDAEIILEQDVVRSIVPALEEFGDYNDLNLDLTDKQVEVMVELLPDDILEKLVFNQKHLQPILWERLQKAAHDKDECYRMTETQRLDFMARVGVGAVTDEEMRQQRPAKNDEIHGCVNYQPRGTFGLCLQTADKSSCIPCHAIANCQFKVDGKKISK